MAPCLPSSANERAQILFKTLLSRNSNKHILSSAARTQPNPACTPCRCRSPSTAKTIPQSFRAPFTTSTGLIQPPGLQPRPRTDNPDLAPIPHSSDARRFADLIDTLSTNPTLLPDDASFLLLTGPSLSTTLPAPVPVECMSALYAYLLSSPHIEISASHYNSILGTLMGLWVPRSIQKEGTELEVERWEFVRELVRDMGELGVGMDGTTISWLMVVDAVGGNREPVDFAVGEASSVGAMSDGDVTSPEEIVAGDAASPAVDTESVAATSLSTLNGNPDLCATKVSTPWSPQRKLDRHYQSSNSQQLPLTTWAYNLYLLESTHLSTPNSPLTPPSGPPISKSAIWEIFSTMRSRGAKPDLFTYEILLLAFGALGDAKSVRKVFLKVTASSNIWEPLSELASLAVGAARGSAGAAVKSGQRLRCRRETFAAAMEAFGRLGDQTLVNKLMHYMKKHRFRVDRPIVHANMRCFLQQRKPFSALKTWDKYSNSVAPDATSYMLLLEASVMIATLDPFRPQPSQTNANENNGGASSAERTQPDDALEAEEDKNDRFSRTLLMEDDELQYALRQKSAESIAKYVHHPLRKLPAMCKLNPSEISSLWQHTMRAYETISAPFDSLNVCFHDAGLHKSLPMLLCLFRAIGRLRNAGRVEELVQSLLSDDAIVALVAGETLEAVVEKGVDMDAELVKVYEALISGWIEGDEGDDIDEIVQLVGKLRQTV